SPEEFRSSILLALAFGAKGIQIWKFATDLNPIYIGWTSCPFVYWKCLAESLSTNYRLYPLGQVIKDNIAPRLRGKLGNTLLKLKYTGNFIKRRYFIPTTELFPGPDSFQYLTVGLYEADNKNINWHIGFLVDSTDTTYNKFFLLTNLLTEAQRSIRIDLTKPVAGFNNYRFRNVEPQYNFDTTYQNTFTATLNFPAGEGYLYQVALWLSMAANLHSTTQ
ncbi:MAG: hypothetical protein ACK4ON_12720, partial [Bacteroidia bacterium]